MNVAQIERVLLALPGVQSLHDLHVWAISSGKVSLSVHLVSESGDLQGLTAQAALALAQQFNIHHSTVQLERQPCAQASGTHRFG